MIVMNCHGEDTEMEGSSSFDALPLSGGFGEGRKLTI
jgi:hypothetical protein